MDSFNFKFCFSQTPGLFFIALYRELKIDVGLNFFYRVDVVGLSFFLNTNYSSWSIRRRSRRGARVLPGWPAAARWTFPAARRPWGGGRRRVRSTSGASPDAR